MDDNSSLTIAPNSKLEIKELKRKNLIKILKGALRAKVLPQNSPSKKNKMIVSSKWHLSEFGERKFSNSQYNEQYF